jgi:hypothetical protein
VVPCFLRAAYTTALHPFAMGGPRTKLLSPTGSSSFVTSVFVHSVFDLFHCIRDTASYKRDMTFRATFQFHNNFQHVHFTTVCSETLYISLILTFCQHAHTHTYNAGTATIQIPHCMLFSQQIKLLSFFRHAT